MYDREYKFYQKYLKEDFFIDPNVKEHFSSYVSTSESKLIIGMVSTLLRENLGAGKKILSCNFTGDDRHDFPIEGICNLKKNNFEKHFRPSKRPELSRKRSNEYILEYDFYDPSVDLL